MGTPRVHVLELFQTALGAVVAEGLPLLWGHCDQCGSLPESVGARVHGPMVGYEQSSGNVLKLPGLICNMKHPIQYIEYFLQINRR